MFERVVTLLGLAVLSAAPLRAQDPPPQPAAGSVRFCGQDVPPPAALPPTGSPPVLYLFGPCFEAQGGTSVIEPETYLYYIHLKPSLPSQGTWTPWDEAAEKTVLEDFHRLWDDTKFLDDLKIDVYLDAGQLAYRPTGELTAGRKLA